GVPEPVGPERGFVGQPDRPRPRRASHAVVRVGDPGRGDPAHGAGGFAGRPGAQRRPEPQAEIAMTNAPILRVDRLGVALPRGADRTHALRELSLTLSANEILCLVGESGSGKSMTASAIMRLLPAVVRVDSGSIEYEGQDLLALDEAQMRRVRGARIAMVFQ